MFIEYEICKRRYIEAKRQYHELLTEKEQLFAMTQPNAIRYDKDKIISGNPVNPIEAYIEKKEQSHIEERIKEAKEILDSRKEFLKMIEKDLRASKEIKDIVYAYRFIDHMNVYKIKRIVNYSKSQMYRILDSIKEEINEI